MRLQRSTRVPVDIDDLAFRVRRQVDTLLDLDLCHLLINLGFLLGLGLLDERHELPRDRCDLIEEAKFLLVELLCFARQRTDDEVDHSLEDGLVWIWHFGEVVFVRVSLHVPNDLVTEELRDLGGLEDEPFHVVCGWRRKGESAVRRFGSWLGISDSRLTKRVGAKSLHDLRDVEKDKIDRVLLEDAHSVLQDQRLLVESWQEVAQSRHRRHWRPEDKVLQMWASSRRDF